MVDITAIGVVSTSLNTAINIAKAMVDIRDATQVQGKVFELQRAILDAQQSVFAANEERTSLLQLVDRLEKEIADLKAWEAEKNRYELTALAPNVMAYKLKSSERNIEPIHLLCANCFTDRRKAFLIQTATTSHFDRLKCGRCGNELLISKDRGPPRTPINRSPPGGSNSWMG
jgi:hypothetical protein